MKLPGKEIKELVLPATLNNVRTGKEFISQLASEMGFGMLDIFQIELMMDEACTNAIDHGSTCQRDLKVILSAILEEKKLGIMIKDYGGKEFNPTLFERMAQKKTWGIGGRGIKIINEVMDEVMYLFIKDRTTTLYVSKTLKDKPIPEIPEPEN